MWYNGIEVFHKNTKRPYWNVFPQAAWYVNGVHTNGGFISIVNWGVSAEISAWKNKSNFLYNTNRIFEAFERSKDGELLSDDKNVRFQIAREIAVAIENIDGWSYNDYYERKN